MVRSHKYYGHMVIDQKGFTLIEAMVAIVIFAIGILGAYQLQLHAVNSNATANRVSISTNLAAYAVEELIANDYKSDALTDEGVKGVLAFVDPPVTDIASINNADGFVHIQPDGSVISKEDGPPFGNPLYSVYWNIAEGIAKHPQDGVVLNNVKQIQVHVVRHGGIGDGLLHSHTYYKARWPESDDE